MMLVFVFDITASQRLNLSPQKCAQEMIQSKPQIAPNLLCLIEKVSKGGNRVMTTFHWWIAHHVLFTVNQPLCPS